MLRNLKFHFKVLPLQEGKCYKHSLGSLFIFRNGALYRGLEGVIPIRPEELISARQVKKLGFDPKLFLLSEEWHCVQNYFNDEV